MEADAKEVKVPAALLIAGVVIVVAHGVWLAGPAGGVLMLAALLIGLLINLIVGVIGCLITVRLVGSSFGFFWNAILKLSAVIVFPFAVAISIPVLGWVLAFGLYLGLLRWLFDLQWFEVVVLVVVLMLVDFFARFATTALVASLAG